MINKTEQKDNWHWTESAENISAMKQNQDIRNAVPAISSPVVSLRLCPRVVIIIVIILFLIKNTYYSRAGPRIATLV